MIQLITTDRDLLEAQAGVDGGTDTELFLLDFMRSRQRPCGRCDGRGRVGHRAFPVVCPQCQGRRVQAI